MNEVLLGAGHVHHSRHEGAKNAFRYSIFFLQFRCSQEIELRKIFQKKFRFLFSLRNEDYLAGLPGSLDQNAKYFLKENCQYEAEEIWLHTMPRMFGYVFNPVTFWLCKKEGRLNAVLAEVRNTFGEKHFYWLAPESGIQSERWFKAQKVFHVSPFFPVDGHYLFRFQTDVDKTRIDINYHGNEEGEKLRLATWIEGRLESLENSSRSQILLAYGWMTPFVVFKIHYQALKLFFKKSRFYSKPNPPRQKVTL